MRKLTAEQSIRVVESSMATRDLAVDKLCGVLPQINASLLRRLTDEGFLRAVAIEIDGVCAYMVWLNFTLDGGCYVNFATQLASGQSRLADLAKGLESLARERGCEYLQFSTERAGLVQEAIKLGYRASGINLRKALDPEGSAAER